MYQRKTEWCTTLAKSTSLSKFVSSVAAVKLARRASGGIQHDFEKKESKRVKNEKKW